MRCKLENVLGCRAIHCNEYKSYQRVKKALEAARIPFFSKKLNDGSFFLLAERMAETKMDGCRVYLVSLPGLVNG